MNLENLQIERIITHEIFQKDISGNKKTPSYSNSLLNLDQKSKDELTKRIINVLGKRSHSMEMYIDGDENGSVYKKIEAVNKTDESTFINSSKEIAKLLSNSQNSANIPGGIVIVIDGNIGINSHYFLCIIKAELHGGFLKKNQSNLINIEYNPELLLTPQQKLYKIGFFSKTDNNGNKADYSVLVFDHNMTLGETRNAASYFYETFLGCVFNPSDKKLTKDFYNYTKEFINSNEDFSVEDKVDLNQSLYTYLKVNTSDVINASTFAEEYIPNEKRDNYITHLENNNVPTNSINKDLEYIKTKLRRRGWFFTSKVKIYSPSENFDDLIKIIETTKESTTVQIKGTLESQE